MKTVFILVTAILKKNKIKSLFPFGYGLSYANFQYSGLKLSSKKLDARSKLEMKLNLKNTDKVEGSEVVQLYIKDLESSVDRRAKELKGFKKVSLKPNEEKRVEFIIDRQALSFSILKQNLGLLKPENLRF